VQTINVHQAAEMIRHSNGKLFSVTFVKRKDGSRRRMTARTGVRKGVTGEGQKFNPADHDLLVVHEFVSLRDETPRRDTRKGLLTPVRCIETQFRSVPIEGIVRLKIAGQVFEVQ
jgi:hypothetical protein